MISSYFRANTTYLKMVNGSPFSPVLGINFETQQAGSVSQILHMVIRPAEIGSQSSNGGAEKEHVEPLEKIGSANKSGVREHIGLTATQGKRGITYCSRYFYSSTEARPSPPP